MTIMLAGLAAPVLAATMILSSQETTMERDVVAAWEGWHQARVTRDRTALDWALADEFRSIDHVGRIHSRAEYLGLATREESRITAVYGEEQGVRLYGDTAVLTGRVTVNRLGSLGKEAPDPPVRVTAVFVMRDGRWQAASLHATRIGPAPGATPGLDPAVVPAVSPRPGGGRDPGR